MKTLSILLISLLSVSLINAQKDTTKITIGKNKILIINENDNDIEIVTDSNDNKKFEGHWGGIDLGINGYLNPEHSTKLNPEDSYLELHTSKSWGIGINIIEKNIELHENNIGIVTGLGLDINNYRFNNKITLMSDSTQLYAESANIDIDKNKLVATYLTVPLLIEFQFPVGKSNKRLFISAGGTGGLRIGSHTKQVYDTDGKKNKDKIKKDFYLSPFKYGLTLRAGYSGLNLFVNYSLSTLFENNEGPELYPFCIGISFSIL